MSKILLLCLMSCFFYGCETDSTEEKEVSIAEFLENDEEFAFDDVETLPLLDKDALL